MIYTFCNLNYEIDPLPIQESSLYEPFRGEKGTRIDVHVPIRIVEHLTIPEEKPVFQNIQGLSVVRTGDTEYRYYRNFFTGEIRELLVDQGQKKELQIQRLPEGKKMTELDLINCLAFEKMMYERGRFILHSSFIETPKGAILFTAPSGTGKSTQADLWAKHRDASIINGDRTGIWKEQETWMAGGVPWCGTSGIMKNKTMPLRAIVILRQGPDNELIELSFFKKVRMILEQLTINPWNQKMLVEAQMISTMLCKEIPVLFLSCRPDEGAVATLEQALGGMEDGK